ncbi:MAG: hypothetical protein QOG82_2798 [Actinomycetota bacterium]|jgi:molybdopterin-guanine dinucleotide biosynthesis protein A|nr:hypothetical protein [Actinomycetota bacterium]
MGLPVDTGLVVAVVLAGGAGRRLGGVDKAGLVLGGRTLLDRVLSAAAGVAGRLVVVGRPRAVDLERAVIFVQEDVPGGGPVPAVAAALDATGGASVVLILAVDLPLLTTAALARLVDELLAADPSVGAAAAADPSGRPNPLLAAYRAEVLAGNDGAPGAAARALLPPDTRVVDLGPEATLNVNTPADVDRAAALLAAPDLPGGAC